MTLLNLLRQTLICVGVLAGLAACGAPQVARGINDPYEARNRAVYASSQKSDGSVLRPVALAYGKAVPEPVQRGISNFSNNFGLAGVIVNDVLQANIDDATHNFARLLINSTFGIGGVFDAASSMGLYERDSDFGETLHVWGASEGHYVVAPFIGPSTKRDMVGKFVDLFTNPLGYALPKPERYLGSVSKVASKIGDRYRFQTTVDSLLYESADSYAQARLLYLEKRRFELGGAAETEYFDPYEDIYAD